MSEEGAARKDGDWLVDGGELGELIREHDWSSTAFGPRSQWGQPLRSIVNVVVESRYPMALLWGPDLRFIYNDAYRDIAGDRHPQALGRPTKEIWPEVWSINEPLFRAVMERGETLFFEDKLFPIRRGGEFVNAYFTLSYSPIRVNGGQIGGTLVVLQETTTSRVRRRLQESEARLRTIVENVQEGISLVDLKANRYVFMSPSLRELTGFSQAELEQLWAADAYARVHPDDRDTVVAYQTSVASGASPGGRPVVYRWLTKKGGYRWFSVTLKAVRDDQGRPASLVGVTSDITDRKNAEDALRLSEERFRMALRNTPIVVSNQDRELRYTWIYNPHPSFDPAELIGRTEFELVGEEDAARLFDIKHRVLLTGRPSRDEVVVHLGGRRKVYDVSTEPLRDHLGGIVGVTTASIDITDRKEAEERLREADRRKNEFLAMLSHELRNPLAPIRSGLEILERSPPGSKVALRAQEILKRQVDHMSRLVDDLLDVTRISRGMIQLHRETLDLCAVARRAVDDHRELFSAAGVSLEVTTPAEPVWVDGDRTRLSQAIGNLLQNAAKFTPRGGATQLSISPSDEPTRVFLRVRDTGRGIPGELLPRLFEPFMQADASIDRRLGGLGLGLSLVKSLVEMHGGSVRAESEGPGKGATFSLELPLLPESVRGSTVPLDQV